MPPAAIHGPLTLPPRLPPCSAANHTRVGQFEGFLEIEERDELALMEAVYKLGPVSVAMDACECRVFYLVSFS